MTSKEDLKDKINQVLYSMDRSEEDVKQLIRDCIEAVTPDKEYAIAWTTDGSDGKYETEFLKGHNQSIDTIEANTKELLK